MKQLDLRLIPAPGQKPEFLAKLQPTSSNPPDWWNASDVKLVVLEGYTRDPWAMDTSTKWHSIQVQSIDGRNKLPGFVNYLRERKKTAFGRFGPDQVWVVSHKQASSSTLACRVAPITSIPNCPMQPRKPKPAAPAPAPVPTTATYDAKKKKKGFGLLGNLVGAQKRTNQQVETAAPIKKAAAGAPANAEGIVQEDPTTSSSQDLKTCGQVLAEFRQEMEQEMLDFDISPETVLKVKVDVASKLALLSPEEKQSGRVSMEILKFIVYEQAEEVNEEWIAHKEPSEFMDEATIAIYKEGAAPPEVLEDLNKAELPDEQRGQQRAIMEQRQKAQANKSAKQDAATQKAALQGEEMDDFATLNTNKRDRRTIEDFEREKRQRVE